MLSSDWLIKGVFFFYQFLVFFRFSPSEGFLSLGIPYSVVLANTTVLVDKYHAREKIPSLNSLWRHAHGVTCNSELLGFLASTNTKVKKNDRRQCQPLCLKSLKCIYFKCICIIYLHVVYCSKTLIYSIFDFAPEITLPWKDFSCFPRLIKVLQIKWTRWSELSSEPACIPLF